MLRQVADGDRRVPLAGDMLSGVLVPGHGSVATADQIKARIDLDRAYVEALHHGGVPSDPRIGPGATCNRVAGVHERHHQHLAQPSGSERTV